MNHIIYETLLEEKNFKIKGRLYHYTQVNMAYNTNRIEGSKLSEDQTRSIFETQTLLPEDNTPIKTDDIIEICVCDMSVSELEHLKKELELQ